MKLRRAQFVRFVIRSQNNWLCICHGSNDGDLHSICPPPEGTKIELAAVKTTLTRDIFLLCYLDLDFRLLVIFGLLSSDSHPVVERSELIRRVREWDPGFDQECVQSLFAEVRFGEMGSFVIIFIYIVPACAAVTWKVILT
jgi:hypothetical protein